MKTIFRYPGGKSKKRIRDWILAHRPQVVDEYREPFVGGGGVFWGYEDWACKRWINDTHPGLIAVYEALRDRPHEFIAMCLMVPHDKLRETFDYVKLNEECDQAFRYFFVNRTVWAGRVRYDMPARLYFSNPDGWRSVSETHLLEASRHLQGVEITCGDYKWPLMAFGENVWVYLDPPYMRDTELTGTDKQYQFGFTRADHAELARLARLCPHKIAISYDDHPLIRELYRGFRLVENSWAYAGTACATKRIGRELLILNYGPAEQVVAA